MVARKSSMKHGKHGEEHRDTWVYTGSDLRRVKPYVQLFVVLNEPKAMRRVAQGAPQGHLILAGALWVTSLGLGVQVDYNRKVLVQVYPVIFGLSRVAKPRHRPCLIRQGTT